MAFRVIHMHFPVYVFVGSNSGIIRSTLATCDVLNTPAFVFHRVSSFRDIALSAMNCLLTIVPPAPESRRIRTGLNFCFPFRPLSKQCKIRERCTFFSLLLGFLKLESIICSSKFFLFNLRLLRPWRSSPAAAAQASCSESLSAPLLL